MWTAVLSLPGETYQTWFGDLIHLFNQLSKSNHILFYRSLFFSCTVCVATQQFPAVYTNQHWYQKRVETSETELSPLYELVETDRLWDRSEHQAHTWLFFYLLSGFEQIILSALFSVTQQKECQKGAVLWDQSFYIQSSVCLLFIGGSLFGVHLYVNIILPFLKCAQPNPAATQAKAQVLSLLLSHWVGQWIKPLCISTAALCLSLLWRKTAGLGYAESRTC